MNQPQKAVAEPRNGPLQKYVTALTDDAKWSLIDNLHELEKKGRLSDDAPLREHASKFMQELGDRSSSVVLWMQFMAHEAAMQFALRHRAALASSPQPAEVVTETAEDLHHRICEYVAEYELYGEDEEGRDGCYTPNEHEKDLILDAFMGFEWPAASPPSAPAEVPRFEIQRLAQFADTATRMDAKDMRNNMETLAEELAKLSAFPSAPAQVPVIHIQQPYTLAEIKSKIASHDYSAEMLLQHSVLLLDAGAAQVPTKAARDVLAERQRQITEEGWTPEHDDEHDDGDLSAAAAAYAIEANALVQGMTPDATRGAPFCWPWERNWWKPAAEPRRNLVKAGALILAEIERLDRASPPPPVSAPTVGEERP